MATPTTKRALVAEFCRDFKDTPSRQLARVIYQKHGHLFTTLDACYQQVRTLRGNHGHYHRRQAPPALRRASQPAEFRWTYPASQAQPWAPFALDARRTLILSDIHIPFHDTPAIRALVREAHRWRPDCILLNGDVCDFYSISRFEKNPSKSELKHEIDLTRHFLGWLRQQFPRARLIYKFGNHDEWFAKYIWRKAPELWDVPQMHLPHLLTQPLGPEPEIGGVEFLTDQERISIGHLDVLHGHELGKSSIAPPVNPARGAFLKTMECTLTGHLHRTSHHQERTSRGKQIACWSTGCLCGLWPDYARVNKWDHSAARVDLHGSNFSVTPLRVIEGKVV